MRILVCTPEPEPPGAARAAYLREGDARGCKRQGSKPWPRELRHRAGVVQSNHKGVLIATLHANIDKADGAIINPAGITHYGVPSTTRSRGCLPVIEVSPVEPGGAGEWRHRSMIAPVAIGTIQGLGWRSYRPLSAVVEIAREKSKS